MTTLLPIKIEGILPINKTRGKTSFFFVSLLRRLCQERTVGHAGTLDPFATGVLILLVGRKYTRLSDKFLHQDKEYVATLCLGKSTDSYDCEGQTTATSTLVPPLHAVEEALTSFQGTILQTPPMFSAKKVQGKKLYELARKGIHIERQAQSITLQTTLLDYDYPFLRLRIACSKGTYIRSIAEDLGNLLGCGGHLCELSRTRSGLFSLEDCAQGELLSDPSYFASLRFLHLLPE